jgi:hypothetical protein
MTVMTCDHGEYGVSVFFYFFSLLNQITFFVQIVLQDRYDISVLTVNIEFMWLGARRMERLAKARLSPPPISKPRHINSIFTVNLTDQGLHFNDHKHKTCNIKNH